MSICRIVFCFLFFVGICTFPKFPSLFAAEITPKNLHEAVMDRRFRFSKHLQSEFGFFGGDFVGDQWENTWDVGARYFLHLNNTFAIGGSYMYSPINDDSGDSFAVSLKTNDTHTIDAELMISNDAAFRAGKTFIECDLFLTLGMGSIKINHGWNPVGVIGGGIKVYTPLTWLAVRFDVNTLLHPTPTPSGSSVNADVVTNLGFSFLFPNKPL